MVKKQSQTGCSDRNIWDKIHKLVERNKEMCAMSVRIKNKTNIFVKLELFMNVKFMFGAQIL